MTNLFKKKFIRVPHLSAGNAFKEIGRNAFVDWILVLAISFSVGLGLVAGGAHLYWRIASGAFEVTEPADLSKKTFDREDLTLLTERFQAREDMSIQIRKGYRGPPDPSR